MTRSRPTGALYQRLDGGSRQRDAGYVITNGPTESPDGRTLYHTDTLKKIIYAFDKAPDGALSKRRIFAADRRRRWASGWSGHG